MRLEGAGVVRWSWAVCGWLSASWNVGTKGLRCSLGRWEGWGGRLLTQALSRLPPLMNSASRLENSSLEDARSNHRRR